MILFLDFDGVLHPEPAFVKDMLSQLPLVEEILRHQASMAWLVAELANGEPDKTVVVTHHFPHKNSCSPKWSNDSVTAIFGSRLPNEVLLGASIWIHGHTHDSCDYRLGDSRRSVRVVCNPRGYPLGWHDSVFENPRFDPALLVEID